MALIKILNDDSPMPFGKHKGTKMADVPADYLLWLKEQKPFGTDDDRAVREYIKDNMDVLLAEQMQVRKYKRNYVFNPFQ